MAVAQKLAARFRHGEPVGLELEMSIVELRHAFADHNLCEEMLIEPLLRRTSDTWGAARVARMFEEHVAEHLEFRVALTLSAHEIAPRMDQLVEDIDAHMAAEERTFLSPGVLRDSVTPSA